MQQTYLQQFFDVHESNFIGLIQDIKSKMSLDITLLIFFPRLPGANASVLARFCTYEAIRSIRINRMQIDMIGKPHKQHNAVDMSFLQPHG